LIQAAVYAGVPAGMESFRVAESALDELAREQDSGSGEE
jgi:alkylhydroperoxidase/carboxymuconolactone decarboxylase family protein YurZ